MNYLEEIKIEMGRITERYKLEYSNNFDKSSHPGRMANNLMLLDGTISKIHKELVDLANKYSMLTDINEKNEISELIRSCIADYQNFVRTFS